MIDDHAPFSAMIDDHAPLPLRRRGGKDPRYTRHQLRKMLLASQAEVVALKEELANLQKPPEKCSNSLVDLATGGRSSGKDGFVTPPPRRICGDLSHAKGLRTWGDVLVDELVVTTLTGLEVLKVGTTGWSTSKLRMAVARALGEDSIFVNLADEHGRLLSDKDPIVSPILTCILTTEPRR